MILVTSGTIIIHEIDILRRGYYELDKKMIKTSAKPILLGLIVWFTVAIVSIAVQILTKQV